MKPNPSERTYIPWGFGEPAERIDAHFELKVQELLLPTVEEVEHMFNRIWDGEYPKDVTKEEFECAAWVMVLALQVRIRQLMQQADTYFERLVAEPGKLNLLIQELQALHYASHTLTKAITRNIVVFGSVYVDVSDGDRKTSENP